MSSYKVSDRKDFFRKFPRAWLGTPGKISTHEHVTHPIFIDNLSEGGLKISCSHKLSKDTHIKVFFSPTSTLPALEIDAKVMWCHKNSYGLEFTKSTAPTKQIISSIVAKHRPRN